MMKQMMGKDYLYQPIKDIADKYPAWLNEAEAKEPPLKAEELDNYRYIRHTRWLPQPSPYPLTAASSDSDPPLCMFHMLFIFS